MNPAKPLAEFAGTFVLALTIGLAGLDPGSAGRLAPVVIAVVLTIMIVAFARVSGSHFNPVVTLALTLRGDCRWRVAGPYMIAQIVAATGGGFLVIAIKDAMSGETLVVTPIELVIVPTMLFETFFTFALVFVTFLITPIGGYPKHRLLHLTIGLTVLIGAYVAGPVSGAAFNPAVTFGLGVMGILNVADAWIHFAGQLAGGMLGVAVAAFTINPNLRVVESESGD